VKKHWKGLLLWSNHFYGMCAILLAANASVQLLHVLPSVSILAFIYLGTLFYYSWAYLQEIKEGNNNEGEKNERMLWYLQNEKYLKCRQWVLFFCLIYLGGPVLNLLPLLLHASIFIKCLIIISGTFATLYYLPISWKASKGNFRKIGLLKTFSIAWVWAIVCSLLPVWLTVKQDLLQSVNPFYWALSILQLFVFIFVLAFLFDIKDLQRDQAAQVNTLVVQFGVGQTIRKFLVPLLLLYLAIGIGIVTHFQLGYAQVGADLILTTATYCVAQIVVHEKRIHRNILLIDGLMFIKAILGFILI
jgi:hypothetical protein